jgi:hypothetical protein
LPFAIVEHCKPAGWGRRSANDVHNDIDAAESTVHSVDDRPAAIGGRAIGSDKTAPDESSGVVRAVVSTVAPDSRNRSAIARPIPFVPPVTSARSP